jgi:hypothetical protein
VTELFAAAEIVSAPGSPDTELVAPLVEAETPLAEAKRGIPSDVPPAFELSYMALSW